MWSYSRLKSPFFRNYTDIWLWSSENLPWWKLSSICGRVCLEKHFHCLSLGNTWGLGRLNPKQCNHVPGHSHKTWGQEATRMGWKNKFEFLEEHPRNSYGKKLEEKLSLFWSGQFGIQITVILPNLVKPRTQSDITYYGPSLRRTNLKVIPCCCRRPSTTLLGTLMPTN